MKVVGRGGFGVVWEAYDDLARQHVAVKVLNTNLAGDRQRRERFFRGAQAMMQLVHPAVVRVLEPRGQDGGFYYFVMELVSGGNLREAVLAQRVKPDEVLSPIVQVGDALALAHARGMVHRDIKPANILLDEQGDAKLTDFDLVGAHDTTGGTRTGAMGTVVYAAPECLDKPQDATAPADVFGLGMTAIFCLSGQELTMDTFMDRAGAVARLDCSPAVRAVLQRAVAWQREDRFVDAEAMIAQLRSALTESEKSRTRAMADAGSELLPHVELGEPAARPRQDTNDQGRDVGKPWVASGEDRYGRWAAFEVSGVRQRMRWIVPGTFLMGSPASELGRRRDEGPQHKVTLTRGYWLGVTPVTQALWVAVMGENPSRFRGGEPEDMARPVEHVSWDDCQEFLERLNARVIGLAARLPTEAEWEHACRAGTTMATWAGDLTENDWAPELENIAWYAGNSGLRTRPVVRKEPNPYGLHDMLGNVYEWCQDAGLREYKAEPVADPVLRGQGSDRVIRGGSWHSNARGVRAAYRDAYPRDARVVNFGFRLAGGQESAPG